MLAALLIKSYNVLVEAVSRHTSLCLSSSMPDIVVVTGQNMNSAVTAKCAIRYQRQSKKVFVKQIKKRKNICSGDRKWRL